MLGGSGTTGIGGVLGDGLVTGDGLGATGEGLGVGLGD